jgi:hypothetical protein
MAEVPQITVRPKGGDIPQLLDENPYAAFDPPVERFADPIDLNPRSRDLIIRTIFGEAQPGDEPGRAAVASVIRNRVMAGRYGKTPEEVVLKPYAFEPWIRPDARARMLGLREDDPHYQSIAQQVDQIFGGTFKDPTGGATHFFAPRAQAALGRSVPAWARGDPLASIGGHLFYAPDEPGQGRSSSPAPASRGGVVTAALRSDASPTISDATTGLQALQSKAVATATAENPYAAIDAKQAQPKAAAPAPPFEGPEQADIGRGGAALEGLKQGTSFGFSDELAGLQAVGASQLPKFAQGIPGLQTVFGLARTAIDAYRQDPNSQTKAIAEKAVADARARYALAKQQYPGTTLTGEIVGGIAVPLPGGALTGAGRTVGARVLGGALQGATAGTLTGAGSAEGDISQRAGPAALGGVAGGVLGGGISAAAPVVSNYVGRTLRGLVAPASRARADVAEAAAQAARTPPGTRVLKAGPETVVADILGEPGQRLARAASNVSTEAGAHLKEFTMERVREQYPRLVAFIETKVGPISDNALDKLKVQAEAAGTNSQLYRQTMNLHWHGVDTPRLRELLQRDSVVLAAAKKAQQDVTDIAVRQRRATPRMDSLEFWDQVKRNIDDKIAGAVADPERRSAAQSLTELKSQLVKELDDVTGGTYKNAREVASGFKGIERAIEDGKKFVSSNAITAAQQANAMRSMTPEAQDAFRRAGINELMKKLSKVSDTHDLWKKLYNSRDAQQKMQLLFSGDKGLIREFEALHHVESVMERLRNKVTGNSSTVEQLVGAGALGGGILTGGLSAFDPTTSSGQSTLSGLALLGHRTANRRVAEHVAQLLTSNNPNAIDQVVKAAAGNETVRQIVRKFAENAAVKSAGAQVARNLGD